MADSETRQVTRPRRDQTREIPEVPVRRIIVKFRDDVDQPLNPDFPHSLVQHTKRLLTVVDRAELLRLLERARQYDPALPNLLNFFAVNPPAEMAVHAVLEELQRLPTVELAYVDALGEDPDVDPDDDDPVAGWVLNQGYLDPAPDGIDAEFAWPRANGTGFTGADGAGVRLIDLEQGWNLGHPDLIGHNIQHLHGTIRPGSIPHGTATLGVVCARDNLIGCVGIAPWLDAVGVVSYFQSTRPDAILVAVTNLRAGDVLVLESQLEVTVGSIVWRAMPVEVMEAEFWLIRLATALGIIVIEAAGNSYHRLDDFVDGAGRRVLSRGQVSLGFRDSGAILVSAASSAAPHEPLVFEDSGDRMNHYGTRVDCYAWGENVTTLTETGYEVGVYASTSAATAIIAGAAAVVQGVARANGQLVSPLQMRAILSDPNNGTASKNGGAVDELGVMPDLRKILQTNDALGILPDVYLRDFVGDSGDPHLGSISASPDVLVVPQASGDPQADFGDPTVIFGSEAEFGQSNFIYVRAWNRGTADAQNVTATVYWSAVSTLVSPDQWSLVGSVTIPLVPAGTSLTVSPAIEWLAADIPATGHYCFVATLDHPKDPLLDPAGLAMTTAGWSLDWDRFQRWVRQNNNLTWRNFNIVDNVPDAATAGYPLQDYVVLPFVAAGLPDRCRPMRLRVTDGLPLGSRLYLEVPISMREWAAPEADPDLCHTVDDNRLRVPLTLGTALLGEFAFPARARVALKLLVQIPPECRQHPYPIRAGQLLDGQEVGRVTWLLVPRGAGSTSSVRSEALRFRLT